MWFCAASKELSLKINYGRLHAGHELIKWRPIYDVMTCIGEGPTAGADENVDLCGEWEAWHLIH